MCLQRKRLQAHVFRPFPPQVSPPSADVWHTTMKFDNMAFPREFLWAALLVSLLSVWLLVGLFYQLNRYTRRGHFSIWTGAWLFYALWMTLSLGVADSAPGSLLFTINQFCVSISAALLLWGSMTFLGLRAPPVLSAILGTFLALWILASPQMLNDPLQIHLPVFVLLGLSSPFAGVCFLRLQKQKAFAGLGMLSLGFLLWVSTSGVIRFPTPMEIFMAPVFLWRLCCNCSLPSA